MAVTAGTTGIATGITSGPSDETLHGDHFRSGPATQVRAFHHAVEGGDWALVDRLWSGGIVALVRQDAGLLQRALERLPAEVLATHPSMQVFRDVLPVWASDSDTDGYRATMRTYADSCARCCGPGWEELPVGELLIVATG